MDHAVFGWGIFAFAILILLALDLGIFHRTPHRVSLKEAIAWSIIWIFLALLFGAGIWMDGGQEQGLLFLTSYLVEKTLSIDNVFLFSLIFSSLHIAAKYQHRILFWGVLGALLMRGVMLFLGLSLIKHIAWISFVFGGFLLLTGFKLLVISKEPNLLESRWVTYVMSKIPFDKTYKGKAFWIKKSGQKMVFTPLFMALVLVEMVDLIFAVDSIPAVLAITQDPFLVYTSNIFAILGLRSLYFVLAHFAQQFEALKKGIAFILCFVGVKMLIADVYKISAEVSLGVVAIILIGSILLSKFKVTLFKKKAQRDCRRSSKAG